MMVSDSLAPGLPTQLSLSEFFSPVIRRKPASICKIRTDSGCAGMTGY
ncbi:MAG TPA: hypothetical protein VN720_05345 [Rudaea sp.]|nr:hypothetical protein [Rudaea sp.]